MPRHFAPSFLPSLIIPCPQCGRTMVATEAHSSGKTDPTLTDSPELEEVTHSCKHCRSELTRMIRIEHRDKPTAA